MDLLKKIIVGLFVVLVYLAMAVGLIAGVTYFAAMAARLFGIELLIQNPDMIYEAASVCGLIFLFVVLLDYRRDRNQHGGSKFRTAITVALLLALAIMVVGFIGLGIARLLMIYTDPYFALTAGHFIAAALLLFAWTRIHKIVWPKAS